MTSKGYVCIGNTHGWCGIVHRSLKTAKACAEKHAGDRVVYRVKDVVSRTDTTGNRDYYVLSAGCRVSAVEGV